jgi:OmcA/MtrC family decaheme c-type cytochrome
MRNWTRLLATATIATALAMAGCSGDDGKDGAQDPAGPTGPTGPAGPTGPIGQPAPTPTPVGNAVGTLSGGITNIAIDTSASAFITVTFTVDDAAGKPVTGLTAFEFGIAKLVSPTGEPPYWQSYINRQGPASRPTAVLWATTERPTTAKPVTEISAGVYKYTFSTDLEAAKNQTFPGLTSPAAVDVLAKLDRTYVPTLPHRLTVASTSGASRYNAVMDFVPANLPTMLPNLVNRVVTNESCGSCHGASADRSLLSFPNLHGNTRFDADFCVTCHNPNMYDGYQSTNTKWVDLDLVTIVHKLHSDSGDYFASSRDYGHVHYPQAISNCLTCHDNNRMPKAAGRNATDAVAFQLRPSAEACGTCHEINFTRDAFSHQFANSGATACFSCHGPNSGVAPVANYHISNSSSPNNPLQPAGYVQYEYQIASVTVNELNQPTVRFRLLANGTPVDLKNLPAGMALGNMRFYTAWSAPHPGGPKAGPAIAAPVDFNNIGTNAGRVWWDIVGGVSTSLNVRSFDQPRSLGNLSAFVSTLIPAANGYFDTLPGITATPFAYPANAVLKAVGIEGRPNSQGVPIDTSAKIGFAGTPRRTIVSEANCLACHETLAFHGSSRINAPDWCAACHNPENSSSNIFAGVIPPIVADPVTGQLVNGAGESTSGELPMNLKDLLHGLHAGKPVGGAPIREIPFAFIRGNVMGGSGNGYYDFSDIGFPANIADCDVCHIPGAGTYKLPIVNGAMWSVVEGLPGAVPGTTGPHNPGLTVRMAPTGATCYGCHNTSTVKAHIDLNTTASGEACAVCHGTGKIVPGHN